MPWGSVPALTCRATSSIIAWNRVISAPRSGSGSMRGRSVPSKHERTYPSTLVMCRTSSAGVHTSLPARNEPNDSGAPLSAYRAR